MLKVAPSERLVGLKDTLSIFIPDFQVKLGYMCLSYMDEHGMEHDYLAPGIRIFRHGLLGKIVAEVSPGYADRDETGNCSVDLRMRDSGLEELILGSVQSAGYEVSTTI